MTLASTGSIKQYGLAGFGNMLMTNFSDRQRSGIIFVLSIILSSLCFSRDSSKGVAVAFDVVSPRSIADDGGGYGSPVHLADLENQSVKESSGIVASRRSADIFWTHN